MNRCFNLPEPRASGTCGSTSRRSIGCPGLDGDALLVALDLEGICVSLGSACASGSSEPAPVLMAMNVPREIAIASVRLSVGFDNTLEELETAINRITATVKRLRNK